MLARHRGGWPRGLALAVLLSIAVISLACAGDARAVAQGPADATAFVVGVTGGSMYVDLSDVNDRSQRFGTHPRFGFELAGEVRPWLECGVDVGFTMLGESDSLQAILTAQHNDGAAVVTHTQWLAGARVRWLRGTSRWSPYVRGSAGVATLWTSAPGGLGGHESDFAWATGLGLEFYPHRRILLRGEGTYIGQAASGGTCSHAAASLGVFYALPWSALGVAR
jgi:hypothetical protein